MQKDLFDRKIDTGFISMEKSRSYEWIIARIECPLVAEGIC